MKSKTFRLSPSLQSIESRRSQVGVRCVQVMAALMAFMGMISFGSSILPGFADRLKALEQISPLHVANGSRLTTALEGFALLILSVNLWRRKQVAWLLTLATLISSALNHLLTGLQFEKAGIVSLLGIGLFALRRQFQARSDFHSIQQRITVLIVATSVVLVYGTMGFYLMDGHASIDFDILSALRQTILIFTQLSQSDMETNTGLGRYFVDSIYVMAIFTIGYRFFVVFRSVQVRKPATSAERMQAEAIIENYGRLSLARFALFDDKSYFFSPNGSVIAFVVKGRTALVLGDPIGLEDDIEPSVSTFIDFCNHNGWQACFYQVQPDYLEIYNAFGFKAMGIGQEAIVDLAAITLEGNPRKEFRNVVNRLTRLDHRVEIYDPPLNDALLGELRKISDEWLLRKRGSEFRFSIGWFDDQYIRDSTVAAVYTPEGYISAFTNIVSKYQRNEAALDLMRRSPRSEHGTMDFLFLAIFDWARKKGYSTFSLGFSPLSGIGRLPGDPLTEKTLRCLYENMSRFFNLKGLYTFKDKFRPRWESRYMIYPGTAHLPSIAMALARAHGGDDFVWTYIKR